MDSSSSLIIEGEPPSAGSLLEEHRDVSAGQVRLRMTEWRHPLADSVAELDTLIALPGLLAPRASFRSLARLLVQRLRVVAVDFPGFGDSEKPAPTRYPYGTGAFADALVDVFSGLGIGRAHVLGHGLGATVALQLAARHPELVKRVALLAPVGLLRPPMPFSSLLLSPLLGGLVFRQLLGRSVFSRVYRDYIHPTVPTEQLNSYYESLSSPAARSALLATLRSSRDPRPAIADARRLRVPSLLLWGSEDRVSPTDDARRLARELSGTGLEILPAGHALHEEKPEKTADLLDRFFAGERAGSRAPKP